MSEVYLLFMTENTYEAEQTVLAVFKEMPCKKYFVDVMAGLDISDLERESVIINDALRDGVINRWSAVADMVLAGEIHTDSYGNAIEFEQARLF